MSSSLRVLHAEVDRKVDQLETRHQGRLKCQLGCSDCCVDDLSVFSVEAAHIQSRHGELLRDQEAHPVGKCAFLSEEGACRIYENRPYVCRSQGLPLRWIETDETGQGHEFRDICPLNEEGESITELRQEDCFTLGPVEGRLAQLQESFRPGSRERVRLRDLFLRSGG